MWGGGACFLRQHRRAWAERESVISGKEGGVGLSGILPKRKKYDFVVLEGEGFCVPATSGSGSISSCQARRLRREVLQPLCLPPHCRSLAWVSSVSFARREFRVSVLQCIVYGTIFGVGLDLSRPRFAFCFLTLSDIRNNILAARSPNLLSPPPEAEALSLGHILVDRACSFHPSVEIDRRFWRELNEGSEVMLSNKILAATRQIQ